MLVFGCPPRKRERKRVGPANLNSGQLISRDSLRAVMLQCHGGAVTCYSVHVPHRPSNFATERRKHLEDRSILRPPYCATNRPRQKPPELQRINKPSHIPPTTSSRASCPVASAVLQPRAAPHLHLKGTRLWGGTRQDKSRLPCPWAYRAGRKPVTSPRFPDCAAVSNRRVDQPWRRVSSPQL